VNILVTYCELLCPSNNNSHLEEFKFASRFLGGGFDFVARSGRQTGKLAQRIDNLFLLASLPGRIKMVCSLRSWRKFKHVAKKKFISSKIIYKTFLKQTKTLKIERYFRKSYSERLVRLADKP